MFECDNALMVQVVHVEDSLGCAQRMLQLAACAERTSTHPLAAAIVGHAALNLVDLDLDVTSTDQLAGDKNYHRCCCQWETSTAFPVLMIFQLHNFFQAHVDCD